MGTNLNPYVNWTKLGQVRIDTLRHQNRLPAMKSKVVAAKGCTISRYTVSPRTVETTGIVGGLRTMLLAMELNSSKIGSMEEL
jgi:hypothetical protein